MSLKVPKLTGRQIARSITMGSLEYAANQEYERGRYDPFEGGPALARLNKFRKDKRLTRPPKVKP